MRADGWLGDLLGGAAAQSLQPVEPPDGFAATLRPYQRAACRGWRSCPRSGLGAAWPTTWGWARRSSCWRWKPLQRDQDPDTGPTLLLCPMSLVGNWQREAAKFAPGLRVYAHHGGARLHGDALANCSSETDLVVTTYATATRDIDELAGYEWNRVVLDEAQAVKNACRAPPRRCDGCRRTTGSR